MRKVRVAQPVLMCALLALVFGASGGGVGDDPTTGGTTATRDTAVRPLPSAAAVRATTISIPSIGVSSSLVTLGLDSAGALQTPIDYAKAGWFTGGPTPGDGGPAVIAGHVDSVTGPAVFFRLHQLSPGDTVIVTRSDGREVVFTVEGVRRYAKNAFPTAAVYGPVPGTALRLITCGGSFDAAARSYRDNVVVFASATGLLR